MPLSRQSLLVLTALADTPRHGYALLTEVEQLSRGEVVLRVGTLYAALDRLAESGLVEVDHEEVVDGRQRRYWRLTDGGSTLLVTEAERLRADAAAVTGRLALRPVTA